jgi:hypothetical protein
MRATGGGRSDGRFAVTLCPSDVTVGGEGQRNRARVRPIAGASPASQRQQLSWSRLWLIGREAAGGSAPGAARGLTWTLLPLANLPRKRRGQADWAGADEDSGGRRGDGSEALVEVSRMPSTMRPICASTALRLLRAVFQMRTIAGYGNVTDWQPKQSYRRCHGLRLREDSRPSPPRLRN